MKVTEEVKTLIRRLNTCFQLEKKRRSPVVAYECVTKRDANALGLPCFTVSKVLNESSSGSVKKVVSAVATCRKEKRKNKRIEEARKFDGFDIKVIERTVHRLQKERKFVSVKTLAKELQRTGLTSSASTLRKYLLQLGFVHRRKNGKRFLKETTDIVAARHDYMRKIKKYREEGYDIIYLDETWINKNHACEGGWTHNKVGPTASSTGLIMPNCQECGRHIPSGKGERLIVLDAGSKECGFIEDVALIFRSQTKSTDYHDEMNGRHFIEWFRDTLCPAIERPSVIVMDNAPYHNIKTKESWFPKTANNKEEIIRWLQERGADVNLTMKKKDLLEIVHVNKPPQTYETDEIAGLNGHVVLRLPVRHCELNPIELIQAEEKQFVAQNNTTFKLKDIEMLFTEAKRRITIDKWAKAVDHVIEHVESKFWKEDGIQRNEVDKIVIRLDEGEDVSEEEVDDDDDDDVSEEEDVDVYEGEEGGKELEDVDREVDDAEERIGEVEKTRSGICAIKNRRACAISVGPGGDAARNESVSEECVCSVCGEVDDAGTGGDVEWVFCDLCERWMHTSCDIIRSRKSCSDSDDLYFCSVCWSKLY